jgi:hypothetical protein
VLPAAGRGRLVDSCLPGEPGGSPHWIATISGMTRVSSRAQGEERRVRQVRTPTRRSLMLTLFETESLAPTPEAPVSVGAAATIAMWTGG